MKSELHWTWGLRILCGSQERTTYTDCLKNHSDLPGHLETQSGTPPVTLMFLPIKSERKFPQSYTISSLLSIVNSVIRPSWPLCFLHRGLQVLTLVERWTKRQNQNQNQFLIEVMFRVFSFIREKTRRHKWMVVSGVYFENKWVNGSDWVYRM